VELTGWKCRIQRFAAEGEASHRAVGFFNLDSRDRAIRGQRERQPADAFLLTLGLTGEREQTSRSGRKRQRVHLLFKLRVAQQETQWRAQVVELLGLHALHLRLSRRVEPGVFAVEQEDLARRRRIIPSHAAGLEQQQIPAFGAMHSQAFVALGKARLERMKLVVMAVHALGEVVRKEGLFLRYAE